MVAAYGNGRPAGEAGGADGTSPRHDERSHPLMSLDLRAHLRAALRPLQQQPDTAAFLGAALDLLPPEKKKRALQALAEADNGGGHGAGM